MGNWGGRKSAPASMSKESRLRDLISTYLSSPSTSSAIIAASQITSLCDPKGIETFCWTCWTAFIEIATSQPVQITDEQQVQRIYALVDLVAAIRDSDPLRTVDGDIGLCWELRCWQDLPLLGASMREAWDDSGHDTKTWERKNTLAAVLTAKGVSDCALYAIWTFRGALEGDFPAAPSPALETSIPAAAAWIEHAGSALIGRDDDYGNMAKGGSLWNGKNGFCSERWVFWQNRLEEIAGDGQVHPSVRRQAERAASSLDQLLQGIGHRTR